MNKHCRICRYLSVVQPETAVAGVPAGETGEVADGEVGEVGELPVGEASAAGLLGVCVGKLKVLTLNGSSTLLTRWITEPHA